MKVCVIQTDTTHDKARNLRQAEALMRQAMREEAPDLLLLPEHFDFAGGTEAEKLAAGEPPGCGPAWMLCRDFAREHRVNVVAGSFFERAGDGGRVRNTSVLFDRLGVEKARYAKIHLFDIVTPDGVPYRESATVLPGIRPVTGEVDGWRIGLGICYDLRFPELFRQAGAEQPVDLFILPAAFTETTGKAHWEVLLRARAIENLCYVMAPAQGGRHPTGRMTHGNTMIIDPWGEIIARLDKEPGVIVADLDSERIARVRSNLPALGHAVLRQR